MFDGLGYLWVGFTGDLLFVFVGFLLVVCLGRVLERYLDVARAGLVCARCDLRF